MSIHTDALECLAIPGHRGYPFKMEKTDVTSKLSALAQPVRLDIVLTLASHREGLSAARLADETGALRTNAAVHLTVLRNAGLVSSQRAGRSITYRVDRDALRDLADFLVGAADKISEQP